MARVIIYTTTEHFEVDSKEATVGEYGITVKDRVKGCMSLYPWHRVYQVEQYEEN